MANGQPDDAEAEEFVEILKQVAYNTKQALLLGLAPPNNLNYEEAVRRYNEERQRKAEQKAAQARQNNVEFEAEVILPSVNWRGERLKFSPVAVAMSRR